MGHNEGNDRRRDDRDDDTRDHIAVYFAKRIARSLEIGPSSVRGVEVAGSWDRLQRIVDLALIFMREEDLNGKEISEIIAFDDDGTPAGAFFGAVPIREDARGPEIKRMLAAVVIARTIWNEMVRQFRAMERRRAGREDNQRGSGSNGGRPSLEAIEGGKDGKDRAAG